MNRTEWRPNKKQSLFLSVPDTVKEALYAGGAGSGKSDVLLMYAIARRWHENPRFKQVFMRRTFPELRNEIVPRSKQLYLNFGATFNRTEMVWTFPRPDQAGGTGMGNMGAMIFLGHCENEDDARKYDSMEINLFTPDEITSFTEYIYTYVGFTRVRAPIDSGLPAIIRAAGMPGGVGHTWVKKRFVDPAPEGSVILLGKGGNKRIYIRATLADNPYIDPTYATSLEGLSEAEKKAKKYGDWSAYLGQVFDEFRDKRYADEPENALHVIDSFQIPSFWPRIVVGDWGFRAQTYLAGAAISPSGRVYIYREESWRNTKIEEWAPYVRNWIDIDKPKRIIFCKSIAYEQGQEHTIQEQIESALGCAVDFPNQKQGSRVSGKALVHEYLRWKPKPIILKDTEAYSEEYAMKLLRMKGMDAYRKYQQVFEPALEESNLPKLQIFNNCPLIIDAIKACSYDKPKDNKPAEDVAEFDGDDPYDVLRYLLDSADAFLNEATKEFNELRLRHEQAVKLAESQDYTSYYRNMKKIDAGRRTKMVSMFHKRRR